MSQHPGPSGPSAPGSAAVCTRHPDRPTRLACARCRRPMCPDCLREASVGMQCVDCVAEGQRTTRTARTTAGAPLRSTQGQPVVVIALIVVNVGAFVASGFGVTTNALFRAGALMPDAVAEGEWWRLLTSGFLHNGLLHVGLNMFVLWVLGRDAELVLGRLRFAVIYLVSLVGGSTAVMLFESPGSTTVGASGAVFGVMGALAVLVRRMRVPPGPILITIGINVVFSFTISGISWLGHLGGLVTGLLVTLGMAYGPGRSRPAVAFGIAAAVTVVLVALTVLRAATLV